MSQHARPAINVIIEKLKAFQSDEIGRFRIFIDQFDHSTIPKLVVRIEAAPASSKLIGRLKNHIAEYYFDEQLVWCEEDQLFVDPKGFRQVNVAMNQVLRGVLHQKISRLQAKTMIDVYCGNGNLSLQLEGLVQKAFLESNKHQLAALYENLAHYHLDG